jgi:hypothetical protein
MKFELGTKIESAKVTNKGVELQGLKGDAKVSYKPPKSCSSRWDASRSPPAWASTPPG